MEHIEVLKEIGIKNPEVAWEIIERQSDAVRGDIKRRLHVAHGNPRMHDDARQSLFELRGIEFDSRNPQSPVGEAIEANDSARLSGQPRRDEYQAPPTAHMPKGVVPGLWDTGDQ